MKVHICGKDGEPEHLLSLIREKQECGVAFPLTFEGKLVGNAEVMEISETELIPATE